MKTLILGDCLEEMKRLPEDSIDAVVTDPPYGLEFMGKDWDGANGFRRSLNSNDTGRESVFGRSSRTSPEYRTGHLFQDWCQVWASEALRVLKPGGHMLVFGGSRTYHRMACAIEDAGFEIRDQIMWLYGSGFPKSLDVSKAIDKAAGKEREILAPAPYSRGKAGQSYSETRKVSYDYPPQPITAPASEESQRWSGWGTALKPAHEPIVVARKPLVGTVAANVLKYMTGAINIDDSRIEGRERTEYGLATANRSKVNTFGEPSKPADFDSHKGRWPANVIHDGSEEVLEAFAIAGDRPSTRIEKPSDCSREGNTSFDSMRGNRPARGYADAGSAARFFYCAKASRKDREESNTHPTVKPTELMRYLCRLVTPPKGTVLDPFMGSGSTGKAALLEGFDFVGIEKSSEYFVIAERRICKIGQEE
jgi:site-specific DNA-methyltransferase (adenine-specific)